ncbi:MAG: hypothetical protein R3228_04250, partial [Halioglobus sp.]|nr:hypothetical protein [Halioglobus sp.]
PAALAQLRELVNAEVLQIARETEKAAREKAAREKAERQRLAAAEAKAQKPREQAEPEKATGQAAPARQDTTASRVSELLDKASRLGRIRGSNYRELAQTYRQVLEIQSQNTAARNGLAAAATYSARLAEQHIAAREFDAARGEIDWLARNAPGHGSIARLRESLADTQRQAEQTVALLREADDLIATPYTKPGLFGSNEKALGTLQVAFEKIDAAKRLDPRHPDLRKSEDRLVDRYGEIIALHLQDKNEGQAREFMDALLLTGLGGSLTAKWSNQVNALEAERLKSGAPQVPTF